MLRFHVVCLFFGATLTSASLTTILNQLEKAISNTTQGERILSDYPMVTFFGHILSGYGCWCRWDGEVFHRQGHGKAQDPLDAACKVLQHGYTCSLLDNSGNCNAMKKVYNEIPFYQIGTELAACTINNFGDDCAIQACTIEARFINTIHDLMITDFNSLASENLMHENFDTESNCVVKSVLPPDFSTEKECCGDYPERSPYFPMEGKNDCCNGKVFLASSFECCADGSVQIAC